MNSINLKNLACESNRDYIKAFIIGFVVPNIIIFVVCYFLDVNRAFVNLDYLIPIVLMPILTFRFASLLLFILFFVIFFIDILLIALQLFPFINLIDILYLSSFLFVGPITFRFYLVFLILLLIVEYILIGYVVKKLKPKAFLVPLLLVFVSQGLSFLFTSKIDSHLSFNIVTSETLFLIKNHNSNFFKLKNLSPLMPTKYQKATKPWFDKLAKNKPLSNKLLLIVNESWGHPLNKNIQHMTLEKLKSKTEILEYFEQGAFPIVGATLGGELRELCSLDPQLLDISEVNNGFENCLPNQLKAQGYNRVAMHGTKTLFMYNRAHWYPLTGFNKIIAGGDLNIPIDPSGPFESVSDLDLFPVIADVFKHNSKQFYYWMTITTHVPYSQQSIRNKRFSCTKIELNIDSDSCRLLILQTQFFDGLAALIQRPEMKGVEVIVVGDHPPPIMSFSEGVRVFAPSEVSWIHFKVKDNIENSQQIEHNEKKSDSKPE